MVRVMLGAEITPYVPAGPTDIPRTPEAFLRALGGPRHFIIPGVDRSRCRAVVTLLHGNEPSGTLALHRLLREGHRPAVDLLCAIVNVPAALHEPPVRALPNFRDQNRTFCDSIDDEPGRIARALIALLTEHQPEVVLDLHNTSGSGPAYGVAMADDPVHRAVSGLFGKHMMRTGLKLGTLLEGASALCPVVTVECGGLHQPQAHEVAYAGLRRYGDGQALEPGTNPVEVHYHPARVEIAQGGRIAYAPSPEPGADLTLRPDFDSHNFRTLPANYPVAWLGPRGMSGLRVRDEDEGDRTRDFFTQDGNLLRARVPLKPLMVTTDAAIAASDCLFYAVRADEEHAR